jgi:hypothetical protein
MIRSTTRCDLDHAIGVVAGQGFRGRGLRTAMWLVMTLSLLDALRLLSGAVASLRQLQFCAEELFNQVRSCRGATRSFPHSFVHGLHPGQDMTL